MDSRCFCNWKELFWDLKYIYPVERTILQDPRNIDSEIGLIVLKEGFQPVILFLIKKNCQLTLRDSFVYNTWSFKRLGQLGIDPYWRRTLYSLRSGVRLT